MENCGGGIIKTYGMKGSQQKYPKDCEYVENANIRMPGLGGQFGNVAFGTVVTGLLLHSYVGEPKEPEVNEAGVHQ